MERSRRLRIAGASIILPALLLLLSPPVLSTPGTVGGTAAVMEKLSRWDLEGARRLLAGLPDSGGPDMTWLRGTVDFYSGRYGDALGRFEDAAGELESTPGRISMVDLARNTREMSRRLTSFESEHFVLFVDEKRDWVLIEPALETLESAYRSLGGWLKIFPKSKVRVEIVPSAEDFEGVSSLSRSEIETAGAVGICKFNKIMLLSPRLLLRGYAWRDSLAHEYIHYLLVLLTANHAPIWLQEGVARYGESLWRSERSLYLQGREESLLARALSTDSLVPFEKMDPSLVRLSSMEEVSLAFAQCALAVDFLVATWKEESLHRLLEYLSVGAYGDADSALRRSIGIGMEAFERRWRDYARNRNFREVAGLVVPGHRVRSDAAENDVEAWDLRVWQPLEARRHLRLGTMLRLRGHSRAGLKEYLRALEVSPASPYVINKVGLALLDLSRADEAAARFREAIDIHPDYGFSYVNLASAHQLQEAWNDARRALEKALDINPFNPYVWRDLGSVLMQSGDREGAVLSWRAALRLNPGDGELRRLLGRHDR